MAHWHIKNMDPSLRHYCNERNIEEKELLEPMGPFVTFLIDRKAKILCPICSERYSQHINQIYSDGSSI